MIPTIAYDFNFDYILVLIFASYILYGYFSGGHKQIRLSINLILPFMIIYYLGKYITGYLYVPLTDTFIFELFDTYFGILKYTLGMIVAYFITYTLIFVSIFILSIYAKKYILNENMRAKLGRRNNYLGAAFALINGYVLIYFIILPVFSLNFVGEEANITNFVLEHPPPFSRIARTAEKAVPMKSLADKAEDFQQLMSVDGIENYYNEAIYEYQLKYIGDGSLEYDFMTEVYVNLSEESKIRLNDEYNNYFGETLSGFNFIGISRVLLIKEDGTFLYEELYTIESLFDSVLKDNQAITSGYLAAVETYDQDLLEYNTTLTQYNTDYAQFEEDVVTYASLNAEYDALKDEYDTALIIYNDNMNTFSGELNSYLTLKLNAAISGTTFNTEFTDLRPVLTMENPKLVVMEDPGTNFDDFTMIEPIVPIETIEITDAVAFTTLYENKENVMTVLNTIGKDFENHLGLIVWYVDELDRVTTPTVDGVGINDTIISFKAN
ncbi:MAG: CvpA family protein, partial [Candidatus Izemoplasma sp.]